MTGKGQINFVGYMLLLCILLSYGDGKIDIDGLRGGSVVLECNHGGNDVKKVWWWYDYRGNNEKGVSIWTESGGHSDYNQWTTSTDTDPDNGDFTIDPLTLDDDGDYTCTYDFNESGQQPQQVGAAYTLTVTGRLTNHNFGNSIVHFSLCDLRLSLRMYNN